MCRRKSLGAKKPNDTDCVRLRRVEKGAGRKTDLAGWGGLASERFILKRGAGVGDVFPRKRGAPRAKRGRACRTRLGFPGREEGLGKCNPQALVLGHESEEVGGRLGASKKAEKTRGKATGCGRPSSLKRGEEKEYMAKPAHKENFFTKSKLEKEGGQKRHHTSPKRQEKQLPPSDDPKTRGRISPQKKNGRGGSGRSLVQRNQESSEKGSGSVLGDKN